MNEERADACGIEIEREPLTGFADVGCYRVAPQPRSGFIPAKHDVFGDRHRLDQHEMLMDHADAAADCIAWCRETFSALQPFLGPARYVNYLDHDEAGDPVAAAYGPNYGRLRELKAKYDPENFFHANVNIRPA